jgi:AcrR family transcriptional regulator
MARWSPDAAGRLKIAALELFSQRGFANVTVAQLAEHAGMTERTFFRHYAGKEDVLFPDNSPLREALIMVIANTPKDASHRRMIISLATFLSELFADGREVHRQMSLVMKSEPSLRARELLRDQEWSASMAKAFECRGLSRDRAMMLATVMTTTFRVVYDQWVTDRSSKKLVTRFSHALYTLIDDLQER